MTISIEQYTRDNLDELNRLGVSQLAGLFAQYGSLDNLESNIYTAIEVHFYLRLDVKTSAKVIQEIIMNRILRIHDASKMN